MNFKAFMNKLLPSFSKRPLIAEIDQLEDKLKSFTLPAVTNTASVVGTKLVSKEAQALEDLFSKSVKKGNMFKVIEGNLNNALTLCNYLEENVEAKFADDISNTSLSLYRVNLLKLIETLNFYSDYARRLAVYVLTLEINESIPDNLRDRIVPAEVTYINNYKYAFIDASKLLNQSLHEIEKKLNEIPDVDVNADNYDSVSNMVGTAKADPLKLNFISPRYSPAMFVVVRLAKYQADKYKQAQADLQEVQCRILKLRYQKQGKEDAKLDKQIEYYTNLNDRLKADIEEMENDYGIH